MASNRLAARQPTTIEVTDSFPLAAPKWGCTMVWNPTKRPIWLRCTVGVLAAVLAAAFRWQFLGLLELRAAFVTFYPAVAAAALYGGFAGGLLATVVSAALANYFWMEPVGQFGFTNIADVLAAIIFLAGGILITYLAEATYRAYARAHKADELAKSNEQLREIYRRLQSAREEERTMIAREIHDEFGQTLTALKFDLAWMEKRLYQDQTAIFQKIESMSKIISMAIQSIKKLSTDLRPGILDDFGLCAAIEWQAEEFETRTGKKCKVAIEVDDVDIKTDVSTAIFRIMQETLTNIMRHANAERVELLLREEPGELLFMVRDDGIGLNLEEVNRSQSYGLMGIRERAYSLGGTVEISSSPGKGTTVCVRLPLGKREREK